MNRCEYCGARFAPTGGRRKTNEHLMPRVMGGTLTIPVCYSCNHARGCSMVDKNFLRFVDEHPETWGEAVERTQIDKFKTYIDDHPKLRDLPIIRGAIHHARIAIHPGRSSAAAKRRRRYRRPPPRCWFYGLRSQEERPKLSRMTGNNKKWFARRPQHEPFEDDSRRVEITMIRSRIPGARGKNRRVLKARLRQLNVMNWADHEEAMRRLRIERAPVRF